MDSGRRSFVGALLAFLLAPFAIGGCQMPRKKNRRLAKADRVYPHVAPRESLFIIHDSISKALAVYGTEETLDRFVSAWREPFGTVLDNRITRDDGRIHWLYDGQPYNLGAFEVAVSSMQSRGTDVIQREQHNVMCMRLGKQRVIAYRDPV